MAEAGRHHYRRDLALVHHLGFGFHADRCAEGILSHLEAIRRRRGLVLELGCGSGALTRHLVQAGHRVIATDASPEMLDLARREVGDVHLVRHLVLPEDPLPHADAIVSVGHVLNYLPDETAVLRALAAVASALRPGGVLVMDICDLRWGQARRSSDHGPGMSQEGVGEGRVGEDWAIITRFSLPSPDRYIREMTTFVRAGDGSWRRDDERHDNVLVNTAILPAMFTHYGVRAEIEHAIGDFVLPDGLVAIVGTRPD